ncbi:hypothetical protein V6N11_040175 [Hibiscus sabdariffa]|uniref:Uncharacterized protein n=1 Tax=Hibiscus sabdariffa TaxID=183260 RepID=A0ABR2RGQ0_9ROSI
MYDVLSVKSVSTELSKDTWKQMEDHLDLSDSSFHCALADDWLLDNLKFNRLHPVGHHISPRRLLGCCHLVVINIRRMCILNTDGVVSPSSSVGSSGVLIRNDARE